MATHVVLVRGINVGGHKKLRMAEMKAVCESAGLADVETYLQSGNAVGESKERPATIASRVVSGLRDAAGLDVGVIVRSPRELARVVERNPFAGEARAEPNRVMVAFLDGAPSADAWAALRAKHAGPERMELHGSELYIHYPDGGGKSKLTPALIERVLGVTATQRNWNTVTALLEIANRRASS